MRAKALRQEVAEHYKPLDQTAQLLLDWAASIDEEADRLEALIHSVQLFPYHDILVMRCLERKSWKQIEVALPYYAHSTLCHYYSEAIKLIKDG